MSGVAKKLMGTTAAGGGFTAIEDVFSTYLYTGTGSALTITNGIDLAGEGGLVWIKSRTSTSSNWLMDTERGMNGAAAFLSSNTSNAAYAASSNGLTPNSNGFSHVSGNPDLNGSGTDYASWTFRKAPRFFDVVTYTGDGTTNRAIPHNLGTTVGSIIIKCTSSAGTDWVVWHRGLGDTDFLRLNLTNAAATDSSKFSQAPTDTNFYVGDDGRVNVSGRTHVAYIFAHDPLGPSEDGSDGLIACGSYTGNGSSNGPEINLGWEPQWVLVKAATGGAEEWFLYDSMRGWLSNATAVSGNKALRPNDSAVEWNNDFSPYITSTGFELNSSSSRTNASGVTYIYIAIRRGPMRAPESGTEVFAPVKRLEVSTDIMPTNTGFATDLVIHKPRITGSAPWFLASRLQGDDIALSSNSTAAEASSSVRLRSSTWWRILGMEQQVALCRITWVLHLR
jgi:hypothetical protein